MQRTRPCAACPEVGRTRAPPSEMTARRQHTACSSLGSACQGQAYENRRFQGSHECYPSTRWICCCDCCCLINQSCLGVLRPSSRAAVSPGPHPITMSYHSDHALATQPPSFGSSVGYRERLLRVLMLLPELSHAVTARHQLDTFDPSNRSREGVSRSERKPGPSHVYGRRPPKLEVGAARTQRFALAAVAVFYSGGRPCGSVRFHS